MNVAIYARVSTERQEREDTISSQVKQLKDHAAKLGYIVTGDYIDNGYSGELLARPALDRMRDDAARGTFERVLITNPDRLARKFIFGEIVIEDLKKRGIAVEFLNRKLAETAEDKLLLDVQGVFAEYEKAKIRERVRRGKLHKAQSGILLGSIPPYGYRYIPKQIHQAGRYEIVDSAAEVVRTVFGLVGKEGLSAHAVIVWLAEHGIPPPGRWGRRSRWGKSTILKILHNETYTGVTHYNKNLNVEPLRTSDTYKRLVRTSRRLRPRDQWIPIQVPAIIDADLFHRVQDQLKRNTAFSPRNCHAEYLLRGLLRCGLCSYACVGDTSHGDRGYRCSHRGQAFPTPCRASWMSAGKIEGLVWDAVSHALRNPSILIDRVERLKKKLDFDPQSHARIRETIQAARAKIKQREDRHIEAHGAGVVDLLKLKDLMAQTRAQLEDLARQEAALTDRERTAGQEIPVDDLSRFCRLIARGLEDMADDFAAKQKLLRQLVHRIVIEPARLLVQGALPSGEFAPTTSLQYGRNPSVEFELAVAIPKR